MVGLAHCTVYVSGVLTSCEDPPAAVAAAALHFEGDKYMFHIISFQNNVV